MTAYEIIRSVAIAHGLATHDILGFSRERSVVVARHEAMARVRADRQMSYPAIGRIFHRTHDTVLRGIRRHYRRAADCQDRMLLMSSDQRAETMQEISQ